MPFVGLLGSAALTIEGRVSDVEGRTSIGLPLDLKEGTLPEISGNEVVNDFGPKIVPTVAPPFLSALAIGMLSEQLPHSAVLLLKGPREPHQQVYSAPATPAQDAPALSSSEHASCSHHDIHVIQVKRARKGAPSTAAARGVLLPLGPKLAGKFASANSSSA